MTMPATEIAQSLIFNLLSGLVGAIIGGVVSLRSANKILKFEVGRSKQTQVIEKETRDVNLLLNFDERFNSESFRKIRIAAAKSIITFRKKLALARLKKLSSITDDQDLILHEVYKASNVKEDIFDFFEGLGLIFRRYNVDEEIVWSYFFSWVDGYWQTAQEYILEEQKQNSTVWEDFKYLYDQLAKVEMKRGNLTADELKWDEEDINVFIESELDL
jgi:hypothetical protein